MDNEQGWKRLAEAVRRRRDDRGWTQLDLATRGGPSIDRIQAIEGARTDNYSSRTLGKLERALEWRQGSVRAILAGGAPSPSDVEARSTDAAESDDLLTPDERRMLEEIRRDPAKRERLLRAILAGHGHEPPPTETDERKQRGHRAS